VRAFNALRIQLPLLSALAANSPYWFGRDSGLASARGALVRAYPGRGIPRHLHDYAEYEEVIAETVRAGGIDDYTHVWWDIRLHPRLGTIEVRELDAQTLPEEVEALAALIQRLALEAAETNEQRRPPAPEALAWSAFRAARDGMDAEIVDANGDVRPVRELAMDLGFGEGGAARQRAEHRRGGMAGLLGSLAAATVDPHALQ
jgi:carboxylate-amine ligase